MDLSGIIFVLLAVAWAVFLIPKALQHHDEAARTRSIDRFSESTRVLARREPVNDRDTRLVVTPPRVPAQRPGDAAPSSTPSAPAATRPSARASTRAAARRRRRILAVLLLCVLAAAGAVLLTAVPWWTVVVAVGLTLGYLVLCRTQVKHEVQDLRTPAPSPLAAPEPLPAPAAQEPVEAQVADDTEDTLGISFADLQDAVASPDAGSLWDPLAVTLPTYVTKPKAQRTVRTIDLGEPGTWSSGRTVMDTAAPARTPGSSPAAAAADGDSGEGRQRAVGS